MRAACGWMGWLSDRLDRAADWVAIAIQAVMFVVILIAVLARYVLKIPVPWSEELAKILLVWGGFLGATLALKRGQHVGFDFVAQRLPRPAARGLGIAVRFLTASFLVVLLHSGWNLARLVGSSQLTPFLDIPYFWLYLCIPVAAGLMLIHALHDLFRKLLGQE